VNHSAAIRRSYSRSWQSEVTPSLDSTLTDLVCFHAVSELSRALVAICQRVQAPWRSQPSAPARLPREGMVLYMG